MTTKLSPTEQKILDFITSSPACTTKDVAAHFGKTDAWAGPFISVMFNTKKVLTRTQNLEGVGYRWYAAGATPKVGSIPKDMERKIDEATGITPKKYASDQIGSPAPKIIELKSLVDQFVDTLAGEIATRLRPAIIERLSSEVKSMSKDIVHTAIPPSKELKRILVCGVLSKQGSEMQREFEGVADIRFVTVDDNASLWKSRAAHADSVVLWTNFISHKHQESLTGVGIKPILVTGGITAVKDKLMELSV